MPPTRIPPERSNRGISATDVDRVADELLRTGIRPTVLKIRERLGTGSPNTINPMLDAWWKRLASRLDAGPHALHRLPEPITQITETLWLTALEEGRKRAGQEQKLKMSALERDRRDTDLRRHVLSLREAEFEDRLKDRERTIATLEEQVRSLMTLLQQEQASRASAERRVTALESSVKRAEARVRSLIAGLATGTGTATRRGSSSKAGSEPTRARRQRPTPTRGPTRKTLATRKPKRRPKG